jgi:ribonuclease HI
MNLKLIVDGRAPKPGELLGKAALVVKQGREILLETVQPGGKTSNQSEFIAIINGLQYLLDELVEGSSIRNVKLLSDSQLAVNCIKGIYQVKNLELIKLTDHARKLLATLTEYELKVNLEWVPRRHTKEADCLMRFISENT